MATSNENLTINTSTRFWWRSLTDVDPITLEPLKRLRYPPFPLRADATVCTWFDGHVLGTYLISTGNFTHPLSRRELTREDCAALDAYLVQHRCARPPRRLRAARPHSPPPPPRPAPPARRLGKADVTTAYDNREDYNKTPTRENRVAMLQAAATDLLTSLFASASARGRPAAEASDGSSAAERAAADAARAVDPSHFSDEVHFPTLSEQAAAAVAANAGALGGSSWAAAGSSSSLTNGAMRGPAARINFSSSEQFPSLGGGVGGGEGEPPHAAAAGWGAASLRASRGPAAAAPTSAAARVSAGASATPPTASDFPSLGGGLAGGARGAPSLAGCSSRAPWAEAALAPARPSSSADVRRRAGAAPPGSAAFDYDNNEYMHIQAEAPEPRARRPQGPPPRVDDEASFPGLAAALAASAAADGTHAPKRFPAGGGGAPEAPELGEIAQRSAQALAAVRAALGARAAGREPRAAAQLVAAGEAEVRRLCAKLQAGGLPADGFLAKFQAVVGGREAAAALLPQVVSLLPDAQGRKAVGLCYAAAYLRE